MVRKNFIYCITNRSGGSDDRDGGGGYWLPEVTITAYSETLDPALIWGSNAGANVGGMFGPMSVSGTRKYWQNMTMGGGGGGDGITGIPKHDAISYGLFTTAVWGNIVYAGFDAAKSIQPAVSTWAKGSRIFGHGTIAISGISIGYDFVTGTANTSTLVNLGFTVISYGVIGFVGAAATPYIVGAGIIYGVWSVAGGDEWLNSQLDISSQINFVKP